FTNYLAVWNIRKAMEYYDVLKKEQQERFDRLNEKLNLDEAYALWSQKVDKVFLPVPNECGVLPQDSTYLTLKDINLSKYKAQDFVAGIMRDYNLTQINQIQVSKQADVLVLFFLLEDLFPHEVKKATWKYYGDRTLHDSSLSLCTHAVLAADMKEREMAYDLFRKSEDIDLGPVMTTSDAGIHAASFGGIWQGAVYGFGGLRMLGGKLRIDSVLPDAWEKLRYEIFWKGQVLRVTVAKTEVAVKNLSGTQPVELELCGETVMLKDSVRHAINKQ
ncbi:MAG: glycoside hydrolase family 65 protein, partial [Clostridiales bacterium]|nr:glycoside hydrolase family 65 protein [Clostridiales bacterium]